MFCARSNEHILNPEGAFISTANMYNDPMPLFASPKQDV